MDIRLTLIKTKSHTALKKILRAGSYHTVGIQKTLLQYERKLQKLRYFFLINLRSEI